jgi:tetratricopeptide (TPR) repeat protein
MPETLSLRRIFHRFFPRKATAALLAIEEPNYSHLCLDEKKELALENLAKGEIALLEGNLNALTLFETAANLDPENATIWFRQGLAFFEYGSEEGKEKSLLLASKHFKIAVGFDPLYFEAWVAWGNVLLQLGRFHEEHHYHLDAREKYQKALSLSIEGRSDESLSELFWDYGTVWTEIAGHSGEALDYHLAIQAFESSLTHDAKPPAEFWNDYATACLQLGLLINDQGRVLQAVELLHTSVDLMPGYIDGWTLLADTYTQAYLNSMDERFATKGCDAYARAIRLSPKTPEIWLSWAQLLGETGRLNKNIKPLISSIEKCAKAAALDSENTDVISQWVESLSYLGALAGRIDLLVEAEQKIIKATELYPEEPDLWRAYGICLMSFARYYEDSEYDELAIEKLQYGLSLDRSNAEIWHALGLAHKHSADLTDEEAMIERSVRFLSKAMEMKSGCPSLMFDAACAYLHHSEAMDEVGTLDQAIAIFENLVQNHRGALLNHPEWLFEYACCLDWLGEYSGEEKDFTRAIEVFSHVLLIDPDYAKIHHRIAACYVQIGHAVGEAEHYKRALHHFRLAIRQDEENDTIWLEWGLCLIHLAEHTIDTEFVDQIYLDAEQKISKAGSLGNPQAYYTLACLYSILRKTDDAMHFIHEAMNAKALPMLDELLEDEWLENLRETELFSSFVTALETKFQAREQ